MHRVAHHCPFYAKSKVSQDARRIIARCSPFNSERRAKLAERVSERKRTRARRERPSPAEDTTARINGDARRLARGNIQIAPSEMQTFRHGSRERAIRASSPDRARLCDESRRVSTKSRDFVSSFTSLLLRVFALIRQ